MLFRSTRIALRLSLVGEDGFEPSKHDATDLQSAPFGHSGTPPYAIVVTSGWPPAAAGAGGRIRTPDLLITNQLLYRLSYTSTWLLSTNSERYYSKGLEVCQVKNEFFLLPPLRDFQAQRPVWICSRCGGEQYRYDRGESEHGRPLCSLCRSYLKERRDDHDIS